MKKKIIIIIICILIIIGLIITYINYSNKPTQINLSSSQINTDNTITNELLTSINNNNYNKYVTLTDNKLANENTFNELKLAINKDLGNYKNSQFKEAFKIKNNTVLIYSADFSKKPSVNLTISTDLNNKISGLHYS